MTSTTALDTEAFIAEARRLLNPSPVQLHRVPGWLRKRLRKAFHHEAWETSGPQLLLAAVRKIGGHNGDAVMDHWGTTTDAKGRPVFVTEPYGLTATGLETIQALASACKCEWRVEANSYWYPGHTVRVVLYEESEP